jgi:hypothetical protein
MAATQPAYVCFHFGFFETISFLDTTIQHMIIHMIQVHHPLIHHTQDTNQTHLMQHLLAPMMDILHQQLIIQVNYSEVFVLVLSTMFILGAPPGSPYTTVDPYSEYPTTAYSYSSTPVAGGAPSSYSSSPSDGTYVYDPRRGAPPPSSPSASSAHYAAYDYTSTAGYSPYKTAVDTNGSSSSSAYPTYATSVPPTHVAYGVPPGSHLAGAMGPPPHMYGPPAAGMIPRRSDYYSSVQAPHPMHYQPQSMPYR